jgi:hypothetical protein
MPLLVSVSPLTSLCDLTVAEQLTYILCNTPVWSVCFCVTLIICARNVKFPYAVLEAPRGEAMFWCGVEWRCSQCGSHGDPSD